MNGILLIDKPVGYTSRDVVNIVSKSLGTKKVGHTGTLDPMASGVLVLCVGECLKLVELLSCDEKIYEAKVILGIETDTLDITGDIVFRDERKFVLEKEKLERVLSHFVGVIEQEVPKYSAVHVNGKRLHEYAREGREVELPKRMVTVKKLDLITDISKNRNGQYEFGICCEVSKGTYIRSLVRDIGYALGTVATMKSLKRLKQGNFALSSCFSLENVKQGNFFWLQSEDALDMEKVVVDDEMKFKIVNGQVLAKFFEDSVAMIVDKEGRLLAIYKELSTGLVKPWKVFHIEKV